ncbi:MAG TPA: YetF domain-containing protein [Lacipirellula sp.]
MDSILRGAATYLIVWLFFRISGKRSLSDATTFDAVLLLILSETTQAALLDDNNSMTNSVLLIATLLGMDILLSHVKHRFHRVERVMDGTPVVILDRRGMDHEVMDKERIDREDILAAARSLQGIGNLDDIEYAVLEPTGEITIMPKRSSAASA